MHVGCFFFFMACGHSVTRLNGIHDVNKVEEGFDLVLTGFSHIVALISTTTI